MSRPNIYTLANRNDITRLRNSISDVVLVCKDNYRIETHKIILSSVSSYFEDLFTSNNNSIGQYIKSFFVNASSEFYFPDVDGPVMQALIDCAYGSGKEINSLDFNQSLLVVNYILEYKFTCVDLNATQDWTEYTWVDIFLQVFKPNAEQLLAVIHVLQKINPANPYFLRQLVRYIYELRPSEFPGWKDELVIQVMYDLHLNYSTDRLLNAYIKNILRLYDHPKAQMYLVNVEKYSLHKDLFKYFSILEDISDRKVLSKREYSRLSAGSMYLMPGLSLKEQYGRIYRRDIYGNVGCRGPTGSVGPRAVPLGSTDPI